MNEENEWDHRISAGVKEGATDCVKTNEVTAALKRMKKHKAPGLSGLAAEMIQAAGDIGTQWILDLCNGIMKGKGTSDAIFIVRQMQEKFRVKGKKLYFGFVDLEKNLIRWAMHKLGVEEWLIAAVMSMNTGAKTVVRLSLIHI